VVVVGDLQLIPVLQLPNATVVQDNLRQSHGTQRRIQAREELAVKQFGRTTSVVELGFKPQR
jgi:hypothetical protein